MATFIFQAIYQIVGYYYRGRKSLWLVQGWAKKWTNPPPLKKSQDLFKCPVCSNDYRRVTKPRGSSQAWNKFHNSFLILSLDKSLDICTAMPQVCHNTISTLLQIVPNNQTEKDVILSKGFINLWCAMYFILPPLFLYCLNTC